MAMENTIKPRRRTLVRHQIDQAPRRYVGRLTRAAICGVWWSSASDGLFTLCGRCFLAYLHLFAVASQAEMVKQCATGMAYRGHPYLPVAGHPNVE
jgi:hypothetical protein